MMHLLLREHVAALLRHKGHGFEFGIRKGVEVANVFPSQANVKEQNILNFNNLKSILNRILSTTICRIVTNFSASQN